MAVDDATPPQESSNIFVVPALGRLCLHKLYVLRLEQLQHFVYLRSTGVGMGMGIRWGQD